VIGSTKPESPPIFVVSGGVGTSSEQIVRTVLAQIPAADAPVIVVPHVRTVAHLEGIVERAAAAGGMVVYTLVDGELRNALGALARARGVFTLDLMGELLAHLAQVLGSSRLASRASTASSARRTSSAWRRSPSPSRTTTPNGSTSCRRPRSCWLVPPGWARPR
jgi:regulator of PEP synthase PpsR (kinase-PPPase family)